MKLSEDLEKRLNVLWSLDQAPSMGRDLFVQAYNKICTDYSLDNKGLNELWIPYQMNKLGYN